MAVAGPDKSDFDHRDLNEVVIQLRRDTFALQHLQRTDPGWLDLALNSPLVEWD